MREVYKPGDLGPLGLQSRPSERDNEMNLHRKVYFALLAAIIMTVLTSVPVSAQGPADSSAATPAASADPLPANPVPQQGASATTYDGWRGAVSIYGWFPGIHGTVGALGHDASIHESFSDVFHVLKGVIPIAVELNKGRLVMPFDFFWVKLGIDKGIPLNDFGQTSVNHSHNGVDLYPEVRIPGI